MRCVSMGIKWPQSPRNVCPSGGNESALRALLEQVSHGLQLQPLWRASTAAVCQHVTLQADGLVTAERAHVLNLKCEAARLTATKDEISKMGARLFPFRHPKFPSSRAPQIKIAA